MNRQTLISVIVPVYNVEKYLPWCLDSILEQSYRNFELIIIDDGSTDGSGEICDEYASKDDRITIIHQPNAGLSAARNSGLDVAHGKFVTFVDSDDVIHSRYLERMCVNQQIYNADISSVTHCRIPEMGKLNIADCSGDISTYSATKAISYILYQNILDNSACAKMYRTLLWSDVRFPVGSYYEDLATFYKIYERASKIVHENAQLYGYRERKSSIIGTFTLKRVDVLDITDEIADYFKLNNILFRAAQDRKFSANMNILWLMTFTGVSDDTVVERCWENIKSLRCRCLFNRHSRLKNRLGALVSYCGLPTLRLIFRKFPPA